VAPIDRIAHEEQPILAIAHINANPMAAPIAYEIEGFAGIMACHIWFSHNRDHPGVFDYLQAGAANAADVNREVNHCPGWGLKRTGFRPGSRAQRVGRPAPRWLDIQLQRAASTFRQGDENRFRRFQ
jgi:hypothetical protein